MLRWRAMIALLVAGFVLVIALDTAPAATMPANGSFESTGSGWLSPWYLQIKSGGGGTVSQTSATKTHGNYSALVNVTTASASAPWLVQLSQSKLPLVAGQTYTVSFAAKAGGAGTLDVALQRTASPYTVYSELRFGLTNAWQAFSFSHTAGVSDTDASLHFNLAAATGSIWIDDVAVVQGTASPSPASTWTPTPSVGVAPTPIATPAPTAVPTAGASFIPIADATVRADVPSGNYGSAPTLISDGQPVMAVYMKFDLRALAGRAITRATLRMKVTNGSGATQALKLASDTSWAEAAITYGIRPSLGVAFKTFGGGAAGSWVEVDVTGGIANKAGQILTLGIDATGSDGYAFYSRESSTDKVTLVVETLNGASSTPTPLPTPTVTPSGGQTPAPSSTPAPTPTPSPSVTPGPLPGGPGGKGVALRPFAQYWGGNTAGMNSDFADMKNGGITWARIDLYKTASPDPNLDYAVQAAKDRGINLVVTVRKPSPDRDLGTDADRVAYRLWLAEMVNRYKYHVKHWMIHNEPNLHYEWNINEANGSSQTAYRASVLRYVEHLRDGFETVKGIDPSAKVLFAGLSEWTVERYMDVLVTTDAYRYFDIMSFHPYGRDPDRVLSRFNSFKGKMNLNANYAAKPIWVTEFGFNTSWSNKAGYVTSEQTKATYLAQTLPRLQAAGAQLPIFWYTLHENEDVGGFALTRKNKTTLGTQYLPAFYTYRDLVLPQ